MTTSSEFQGFREKNKDLMRQDVLMTIKKSKSAFVRGLVGDDPVAVFRWSTVRATFQAMNAFRQAKKLMAKAGHFFFLIASSPTS